MSIENGLTDRFSRRGFLSAMGMMVLADSFGDALCASGKPLLDPNLAVFLSDLHVNGMDKKVSWRTERHQEENLAFTVREILKMRPLPANVVVFGDLAWLWGDLDDYLRVKSYFRQLEAVGIKMTLGVGNHDRRKYFLEAFTEYAKSPVPGRIVSKLSLPHADLLMLDTLQEGSEEGKMGPVPGIIDKAQGEWLKSEIATWKRPTFVCCHHPLCELNVGGKPLEALLMDNASFAGFIRGHKHHWSKGFIYKHWTVTDTKRELGLPSACNWGDIGYVTFRVAPDHAVAKLVQRDYWYPKPDMPKDPHWKAMTAENQGQQCRFEFRRSV